jgi:hypothetical protein
MKVWVGYFSNSRERAIWLVRRTAEAAKRDMEFSERDGRGTSDPNYPNSYPWEYSEGYPRWLARLDDGIWAYVEQFELPYEAEAEE